MDWLKAWIEPLFMERSWPLVAFGLRIVLLAAVVRVLWLIWRCPVDERMQRGAKPMRNPFRLAVGILVVLFFGALAYQASWQLTGQTRLRFVEFMLRYDRRQFNPAHQIKRGRILDRHGVVLATTEERDGVMVRSYPLGASVCHLVGYAHPRFGLAGLEAAAQGRLIGSPLDDLGDWRELGRKILQEDRQFQGGDLVLTLDTRLQVEAHRLLGGRKGAVVVLDVADGEVLVLTSTPSFDPNRLTEQLFEAKSSEAPLLNRALAGLYPPGSTFKVAVAAIALEAGFGGTLECPADGYTPVPGHKKIRDHAYYHMQDIGREWAGYGELDLRHALQESSNVFFAQLGVRLGHSAFAALARRYRFNRPVPLYTEGDQTLAAVASRLPELSPDDEYGLAQMAIGQGALLATPIQMAMIAGAIANHGLMMQPQVVLDALPAPRVRSMPVAVADQVAAMMRGVVTHGTGRRINIPNPPIAGKTGTAENPHGASHSWFIGFAPYPNPRISFCVLVEHGGFGSAAALPIARALMELAADLNYFREPAP